MRKLLLLLLIVNLLMSCRIHQESSQLSWTSVVDISGRTATYSDSIILIGSVSGIEFIADGDSVVFEVVNMTEGIPHNYVSISTDENENRRYKVDGHDVQKIGIALPQRENGVRIGIFKSSEAQVGDIMITNIRGDLRKLKEEELPKIEFIGNSITCAMGSDMDIPCDSDQWYDQHRAYYSYASILGRELETNFQLSSVSGIGVYRNWNSSGPTMPQVYGQLHLDMDTTKQYDFTDFTPDLISICLGTNDFSDGDGIAERLPFDSMQYVTTYIDFVDRLYSYYPDAKVLLLNSPMVGGKKNELFKSCLDAVKDYFVSKNKPVHTFYLDPFDPGGCSYHPDLQDHRRMADELKPIFQELLSEK